MGLFGAVMIGIGAMMGPGIFALPGEVAGMVGPVGVLVYPAMGLLTVFTALNYSGLGAAIPLAGGGYSFTSRTLPRPLAFLTGWFFWIGNTLACAMYALIFALTIRGYFWPGASLALIATLRTLVFAAINVARPANRAELGRLPKRWACLKLILAAKRRPKMRVLIISGGRQAQSIADRLLAKDELRLVFRADEHQVVFWT